MKKKEDQLISAVNAMSQLDDKNKVDIKGKKYSEVHTRVQAFREAYGEDGKILTNIHVADEERVLAETTIHVIVDGTWRKIANDFAEEYRGVGMVNKTSALENCITSSIGRALSACGLSGGNYASFEEVDHAMNGKAESKPVKKKAKKESKELNKLSDADEITTAEQAKLFAEGFIKYSVFHDSNIESFTDWYKKNLGSIKKMEEVDPDTRFQFDADILEITNKIKQQQNKEVITND
jgi:hypothetical protein|tara:strand:+ start:1866 stop:2576 length:711 start_codon:yes stop_codon:yes gene_type:complete